MDFGTIQTFISVVGFPIFACCMMAVAEGTQPP